MGVMVEEPFLKIAWQGIDCVLRRMAVSGADGE